MKEIEVILDMRPSPDSPEFILVKQKLAAEGDRLMLVGEPHEQRVGIGGPRVTIQLDMSGGTLEAAFAVIDVIDLLGVLIPEPR